MLGTLVGLLIALALGYTLAVLCSLVLTMGLASAAPRFVARESSLRPGYNFVQVVAWTVISAAAGFLVALLLRSPMLAWVGGLLLTATLNGVLWINSWEARQRGLPFQILISVMTLAGVLLGVLLEQR